MANASVEKLKTLGLRHGEKVVMGLTAALCLLFLGMAVTRPTIDTTPEQVRKATEAAETNLRTPQKPEDILKKLEDSGIKNPEFEKLVDEQTKNKLATTEFKVRSPWITYEPGAGLIRDMPELIAPTELVAYPGRGSALVYELDANGERVLDKTKDAADVPETPRRKKGRRSGGMAMSMPGMMGSGGSAKGKGKSAAKAEEENLKKYEEEKKKRAALLAGKDKEQPKEEAAAPAQSEGVPKEITKGIRWVTITGVLDYKKLRDNYLQALKRSEIAYPHFKQLDVERQVLGTDGEWSDWEAVDLEQNWAIVNNLPEEEDELAPESVRIAALVDPLPFLKSGYWEKVHVASLVPKEKKEVPKPQTAMTGEGMSSSSAAMQMMQQSQMQAQGQASSASEMMQQSMMQQSMMQGGMMPGGGGMGGAETVTFDKRDVDTLMIRSIDFTVEPDKSYRFRLRIVVFNPNKAREDISPGVDNKSTDLNGPWSEPTEEVTMPADVATYALHKVQSANPRVEQVQFQVAKWNPENGVTLVKTFDAGPGEIVGDVRSVPVPGIDGGEQKPAKIDFNSHRVVLDAMGGTRRLPQSLGVPGIIDTPAISLLVRPDGTVVLRSQVNDVTDEVRKNMEANYKRELDESGKKRESSMGSYYGSAMMPGAPR